MLHRQNKQTRLKRIFRTKALLPNGSGNICQDPGLLPMSLIEIIDHIGKTFGAALGSLPTWLNIPGHLMT